MRRTSGHLMRTVTLLALAAGLVAAAGTPGARVSAGEPAADAPQAQAGDTRPTTLGTITARVNGDDPRTWFVTSGDTGAPGLAISGWHESRPGERLVVICGFETETPPIASFTRDEAGRVTAFGDYDGSLLVVVVETRRTPRSLRIAFPFSRRRAHNVLYVPRAGRLDLEKYDMATAASAIYDIQTGTLVVPTIEFEGDRASLEGTFTGTLEADDGNRAMVTDGGFHVRHLPKLDEVRP